MKGKLGNDQDVTLYVHDGTIHQAIIVIKDPHFADFLRDVGQVRWRFIGLPSGQDQQAFANGGMELAINGN
jgi:hypothetical protein